jgi:hypothetical protein
MSGFPWDDFTLNDNDVFNQMDNMRSNLAPRPVVQPPAMNEAEMNDIFNQMDAIRPNLHPPPPMNVDDVNDVFNQMDAMRPVRPPPQQQQQQPQPPMMNVEDVNDVFNQMDAIRPDLPQRRVSNPRNTNTNTRSANPVMENDGDDRLL